MRAIAGAKSSRKQYEAFICEFIVDVHKSDAAETVADPLGALTIDTGKASTWYCPPTPILCDIAVCVQLCLRAQGPVLQG